MRKIISCLAALFVLSLLMAGCGNKKEPADMPYELIEEDGQYYIILDEEYREMQREREQDKGYAMRVKPMISFASIEDMKHSIETCDLTEDELMDMAEFETDDLGRIPIMDLSALTQASFPSCFDDVHVAWQDAEYFFVLRSYDQDVYCFLRELSSKEEWQESIDSWRDFEDDADVEVTDRTVDSEQNAQIVSFQTKNSQQQAVYYTFNSGDDTFHAFESYYKSLIVEGSTLELTSVTLHGLTDGHYFRATLRDLDGCPTEEWISEFKMTDYKETPAWLLPVGLCGAALVVVGVGILVLRRKKRKTDTPSAPATDEEGEQDE